MDGENSGVCLEQDEFAVAPDPLDHASAKVGRRRSSQHQRRGEMGIHEAPPGEPGRQRPDNGFYLRKFRHSGHFDVYVSAFHRYRVFRKFDARIVVVAPGDAVEFPRVPRAHYDISM